MPIKYELSEGFRVKIEFKTIKSKATMLQKSKGFKIAIYFPVVLLKNSPLLYSPSTLFRGLSCQSTF